MAEWLTELGWRTYVLGAVALAGFAIWQYIQFVRYLARKFWTWVRR